MFEQLSLQPADPLLTLIEMHRSDARPDKLDLGVGVYKDAHGNTPVFRAVKAAEALLLENQQTKSYVGPSGDPAFIELAGRLVFGAADRSHVAGIQTVGGTGALRLGSDLLARSGVRNIWVGRPTWANHDAVLTAAGLTPRDYVYFDLHTQTIQFEQMCSALRSAEAGDAVLLQAACHNPIGADLTLEQWKDVGEIVAHRGLIPLIDVAYQGLGVSVEADLAGAQYVMACAQESLVAVSMSKNFGLYRERTGALCVSAGSPQHRELARSNMVAIARANYSMPPDHGAAVVRLILEDQALSQTWLEELGQIRDRIREIRHCLAGYGEIAGIDLAALAHQNGMFSLLPVSPEQVDRLRVEQGIYMTGFGRINLAGLTLDEAPRFAAGLASVV